jgi:hypothetical protein
MAFPDFGGPALETLSAAEDQLTGQVDIIEHHLGGV